MTSWISGKRVLVTGGNSGIGYETARALARAGAEVILTSRSAERAEAAAARIAAESRRPVAGLRLELGAHAAIHAFADEFCRRYDRLDVLFNNAGAWFGNRRDSPDGFELTWAVNHLGPFLVTARLMPLLRQAGMARILVTSSSAHLGGRIDFDDPGMVRFYAGHRAYERSKLGNVLFTLALARRLAGSGISANCFHPGLVATNFFRFVPIVGPLMPLVMRPFSRSAQKGAETAIYLAADDAVAGASGHYYKDCAPARMNRLAADTALQERVWDLSVAQTGAAWAF